MAILYKLADNAVAVTERRGQATSEHSDDKWELGSPHRSRWSSTSVRNIQAVQVEAVGTPVSVKKYKTADGQSYT